MSDEKTIFIYKVKTKICPNGQEMEKQQLTVQGDNLKECRKHFNDLWEE